jgi:hypothetical protein
MHGGGTPAKTVTPEPSAGDTSKMLVVKQKQSMTITPVSTQRTTDQPVADERKGATDREIQVDPNDADKKLHISTKLEENRNSRSSLFSGQIWMCLRGRSQICRRSPRR